LADSVYVIGAPASNTVKIGVTNDLRRRLREIQYMSPVKLAILWSCPGGSALEKALHAHFADRRSHGEWFDFDHDPTGAVRTAIESALVIVPEESEPPEPSGAEPETPPLDLLGMFLGTLSRDFAPRARFTTPDAGERCGYMATSAHAQLEQLVQDGRVRHDRVRRSDWRLQAYYLPA
jgi:hypothetical protein